MNVCEGTSLHQVLHNALKTFNVIRFGDEAWAFALVGYALFAIFFTKWVVSRADSKWSAALWLIVLGIGAIVVQIPNLATGYLHVDESQHIGEGIKLAADPRMWASVDGTTVGPASLYPAAMVVWLGADLDYGTIRVLNLILWCAIAGVTFASFATFLDRKKAFWYTLPLFGIFPFMHHPDYVSYNSETAAALLLAIAFWLMIIIVVKQPKTWQLILFGAVLVLAPLTKVQVGPVAVVLGVLALIFLWGQVRKQLMVIGGVIIAVAVLFLSLMITGSVGDFMQVYIINNVFYASSGIGLQYDKSFAVRVLRFPMTLFEVIETRHVLLAAFVVLAVTVAMRWKEVIRSRSLHLSVPRLSVIFMVMLLLVIGLPGHKYYHYVILVIPTVVLVTGILFEKLFKAHEFRFVLFAACVVLPQAFMSAFQPKDTFTNLSGDGMLGEGDLAISKRLCELSTNGQKIAQWGYDTYIYSETGLVMGTRDTQTHRHIHTLDQQEYYVTRYVGDMVREQPEFFVDNTKKNSFLFDYEKHNYTNYPAIKEYIDQHYSKVEEINGAIIFVRNDLASKN